MDSAAWDQRYAQTELVWSAGPNRFFAEEVEHLSPGRALDLGTGEGRNAIWLAERGWETTAVDFSPVAIEKARSLAAARGCSVSWAVEDLLSFRPEPGAFDLVAVVYIHLVPEQRRRLLQIASRALAPGGRLVVIGHHSDNLTEGVGGPQDRSILFTPEEIVAELDGLQVVRADRVLREVATDGGPRSAVDTVVVASPPAPA